VLVSDASLQFLLGSGDVYIYLFQILQEPDSRRVDQSENQVELIAYFDAFLAGMFDEIGNHIRLMVAHRNNDFIVGDDADGYGGIRDTALSVLDRYTQYAQQPVAFRFRTRTFVGIGNV